MRRRRSVRRDDGITLFPFLAVLICTMGSLIVLLVVMVQQAKASAVDVARQRAAQRVQQEQQQQEQQKQQQREREDLQWQLQVLRGSRVQTAEQLEDRRRELSHLEDVIRDLEQQLQLVVAEAQQMKQRDPLDRAGLANAQQKIEQLKQKIEQTHQEIDTTRSRIETEEPSYAIVPYDGPHGTHRRPIFVECLEDRIVLQPEGIELLADDFREPITDDNPLASALRAKREYLADVLRDEDGRPYPLLVVRPDGARAYAAARAAMKSWEAEFGYELVDAALPLEYPSADPALTALMRRAVDQSRTRRKYLQSIAPARFGRPESVLRPSHRGGFESQPGTSSDDVRELDYDPSALVQSGPIGDQPDGNAGAPTWGNSGPESVSWGSADTERSAADARRSGFADGDSPGSFDSPDSLDAPNSLNSPGNLNARMKPYSSEPRAATEDRGDRSAGGSGDSPSGPRGPRSAGPPQATAGNSSGRPRSSSTDGGPGGPASVGGSGSSGPGAGGAMSSSSLSAAANLSDTRGRDWALPENALGATGITRPIRIACHPDRLVLLPEDRGKEKPEVLPLDGRLQERVDELVSQVWKRMEGWGIAGPGMYWKPVLMAEVAPNGEQRYAELTQLLQNSGITVKRKP